MPVAPRVWGLNESSNLEKKDLPQTLGATGTSLQSFFFSKVDSILFTFLSKYLRQKLRENISLIHHGIIPLNEYDCIVFICSVVIIFLLLLLEFLKKEKIIRNAYFFLRKQTYSEKDRTDPERAQRGSAVGRPSGCQGLFYLSIYLRIKTLSVILRKSFTNF